MRFLGRWIVWMLVGTALLLAAAVVAAADSAEAAYLSYRKAIHAAERCRRDHPFGTPEEARMAACWGRDRAEKCLDEPRVSSYNVRTVFDIVDKSNLSVAGIWQRRCPCARPPDHA